MTEPVDPVPAERQPDLYRVYKSEWVTAARAAQGDPELHGVDAYQFCVSVFQDHFAGRVAVEHHRIVEDGATVRLDLYVPVLKGEFSYEHMAYDHAKAAGYEMYAVVERNTPADHELRAYGTPKP